MATFHHIPKVEDLTATSNSLLSLPSLPSILSLLSLPLPPTPSPPPLCPPQEMFGNDAGMAKLLCQYRAQAGSWEGLLQESQFLDAVTPEEVQRVAGILFRVQNRVSGQVRMASPHLPVPRIDSFVRLTA